MQNSNIDCLCNILINVSRDLIVQYVLRFYLNITGESLPKF